MKNKPIKFRLIAFFYDTEQDMDIEFEDMIDMTCNRLEQIAFAEELFKSDTMPKLNTDLGEYAYNFCVENSHYNAMEFAIYEEISKDEFDAVWLKWKALLTQGGVL